jgi:hypothetical protein
MAGHRTTRELTGMAAAFLAEEHPDAIIVKELTVEYMSGKPGRLDVAAITPNGIIAVEVKGPNDSPKRLEHQISKYKGVCKEVWLLAAKNIFDKCYEITRFHWRTLDYKNGSAFKHSNSLEHCKMKNNPWAIADTLLMPEKKKIVEKFGLHQKLLQEYENANGNMYWHPHTGTYSKIIAENIPLCDLRIEFAKHLLARDWKKRLMLSKSNFENERLSKLKVRPITVASLEDSIHKTATLREEL